MNGQAHVFISKEKLTLPTPLLLGTARLLSKIVVLSGEILSCVLSYDSLPEIQCNRNFGRVQHSVQLQQNRIIKSTHNQVTRDQIIMIKGWDFRRTVFLVECRAKVLLGSYYLYLLVLLYVLFWFLVDSTVHFDYYTLLFLL